MSITPEQCRAARGLLHWKQPTLAEKVGLARSTIAHFERGASIPHRRNLADIREVLEAAGVIFLDADPTAGPGVRLKEPKGE